MLIQLKRLYVATLLMMTSHATKPWKAHYDGFEFKIAYDKTYHPTKFLNVSSRTSESAARTQIRDPAQYFALKKRVIIIIMSSYGADVALDHGSRLAGSAVRDDNFVLKLFCRVVR